MENKFNRNWYIRLISLFLTVSLCLYHTLAFAQPNITGIDKPTISHKDSITISGSGFGSHPDNSPNNSATLALQWDDFEDGVVGQDIPGHNNWVYPGDVSEGSVDYTNINQRSGSTLSTYCDYAGLYPFGLRSHPYGKPTVGLWTELYISYWCRNNITYIADPKNFKEIKIYGDISESGPPSFGIEESGYDPGQGLFMYRWRASIGYGEDDPSTRGSIFENYVWYRKEVWIRIGDDPGQRFKYWENAYLKREYHNPSEFPSGVGPYLGDGGSKFEQMWFPNFIREGSTGYSQYDDIYIDTTQARVEIGDAATFATCTHREIQIPTAWSDNSITFTANQGSFGNGQTAYLYVVDENGNVNSQGYPVTFGAGGLLGDVNQDGKVDIKDLILVAKDFGKTSGFNPACDLNGDARVDIKDLIIVAKNFGKAG